MAISVPNNISDLVFKARRLGIINSIKGTKKDGSYCKEDLIVPIRNKILQDRYGSNIPSHLLLLQNIKSPMLSKRIDEVKQDFQDEIWNDDCWDFEEKINGVRCIMIKDGTGLHFSARFNSRDDLMPVQMPIYLPELDLSSISENFILDCEVESLNSETCMFMKSHGMMADTNTQAIEMILTNLNPIMSTKLQQEHDFQYVFHVFDCLYYNSVWITSEPLEKRRQVVSNIVKKLDGKGVRVREVNHSNVDKRGFFSRCIASGYEGCMAKRLDSIYVPDTKRNLKGWIKIKKPKQQVKHVLADMSEFESGGMLSKVNVVEEKSTSFVDTVDTFITGYSPGVRGTFSENTLESIEVSVMVRNSLSGNYEKRVIGNIGYIEYMLRDKMCSIINGIPTLNPIFYNAVVELDPLCTMVIRLRYDKNYNDCLMEEVTYNQIKNSR
jgi:hypothetical protein